MKKYNPIIFSFTMMLLTSCGTSSFDKNLKEIFYEACYVSSLSHEMTDQTAATWSTAIRDNKDSHGDYCSDFGLAISRLYRDYRFSSVIDSLTLHYTKMESLAKEMSDCPSNRKEDFDEIVMLVSDIKKLYNMALEPSGSLLQFSQDSRQDFSSIEKSLSKFEIKHSKILNNIVIPHNILQSILLDFQAKKDSLAANYRLSQIEFLKENRNKDGVVELSSGLQIKTIKEGSGKKPNYDDKVRVNYVGTLIDGTQFDSGEKMEFKLLSCIEGFREGVQTMKEGGKCILYLPSDLAYGDRSLDNIPAGATLIFQVELLKVL